MDNELSNMMIDIERRLLALKTSRPFLGVKTARYASSFMATNGNYVITYANDGPILTTAYVENVDVDKFVDVVAKTPVGNTQVINVYLDPGIQQNQPIKVVSTQEVVNIQSA